MSRLLLAVMACHFLGAFTVLGMPLLLPGLLEALGEPASSPWVGLLFALPGLFSALSAPVWGRFADRHGRRLSLQRALAGLSLAFALAAWAPSLPWLGLALLLQGLCGGTLAAANAYLASQLPTARLSGALNWTQCSARLALLLAPPLLGLALTLGPVGRLYGLCALLPLLGLVLTLGLPGDGKALPPRRRSPVEAGSLWPLYLLQSLFCFAMVLPIPYFMPWAQSVGLPASSIGLLYSLPHLVYLLGLPLLRRSAEWLPASGLRWGLLLLLGSSLWQGLAADSLSIILARLLFGLGTLLGYDGLHRLLCQRLPAERAATAFGQLDSAGKWAGVLAGICTAPLVEKLGTTSPFFIAALSVALALWLLPGTPFGVRIWQT